MIEFLADWGRMLAREALVALLLGLSMAAAVSAIGLWRGGVEAGEKLLAPVVSARCA